MLNILHKTGSTGTNMENVTVINVTLYALSLKLWDTLKADNTRCFI
jgi:hypothetical protein